MSATQKLLRPRAVIQMLVFIVLIPFLPLLVSGRWGWWEAWVYFIIAVGSFIVSRALAARRNPGILSERARFLDHADTAPWDKKLAPLLGLAGLLIPLAAGLEARFGLLQPFGLPVKIAALAILLGGIIFSSWALVENSFFSGVVRLQPERGQHVVSSGPYRLVRHPGYAGGLVMYLAFPFFIGSLWSLLPVLLITAVTAARTRLEDRFLRENLPGYREYAARVKYRLLPGVW
jgi:protein-S-isoprenylcysteine O-methyltransferase Ste14